MSLSIPIVSFPPFKLRSSMIDKDPLIWKHILEVYIVLFDNLTSLAGNPEVKMTLKMRQQLTSFLKVYLYETSEESSKIFSLGAINPEIVQNQTTLKVSVFKFIRSYGLVNLQLLGESVWNFCKVYLRLAAENISSNQSVINFDVVRQLVEGTYKVKADHHSDNVPLIKEVQDYLIQLVAEKKFDRYDLETLYMLLGQKTKRQDFGNRQSRSSHAQQSIRNQMNRKLNHSNGRANGGKDFSIHFVDSYWIKEIENLYNNGESIHSKQCSQLMVLSLISLPYKKIPSLIKDGLKIDKMGDFVVKTPLMAKVVLSKKFEDLNPDIRETIGFLNGEDGTNTKTIDSYFDDSKIGEVSEVLPQLNTNQIKTLLVEAKGDVAKVINEMLEHPEKLSSVKEYHAKPNNVVEFHPNEHTVVQFQMGKKERDNEELDAETKEELKKRTLEQALQMMADEDDDEPDDTYVGNELTSGPALDNNGQKKRKDKGSKADSKQNALDMKLFLIYKQSPELFATRSRHTNYRRQLKTELGWIDEQIEGWARMLERNPHKYQMLEQQQIEHGGSLNNKGLGRTRYRKGEAKEEGSNNDDHDNRRRGRSNRNARGSKHPNNHKAKSVPTNKSGQPEMSKKKQRDKSKYKAKRANHSRKSGHDKKMTKIGV